MPDTTDRFSCRELIDAIRAPEQLRHLPLRRWDTLLRVARRANLMGRLAIGARRARLHDDLPSQVRVHLDSAETLVIHQRAAINWETQHIARAFAHLDIPVILLKGAAYAACGLEAAQGRLFGDVDILVPRDQMNAAEAALMLQGWTAGKTDPYDQRYYREWMHEIPPMTHRGRGTVIDLHHNILPLTARNSPDAASLIGASQSLTESRFSVLCPVDMVIHSATHLFHESELQNGLRDLFDLEALLVEFSNQSPRFWDDLTERAIQLGLTLPLFLALRYTSTLLGTRSPDAVHRHLQQDAGLTPFALKALNACYQRGLMPDHPSCNTLAASLARLAVYLRGHALRMPPVMLTKHLGRKLFIRLFKNTSRSH